MNILPLKVKNLNYIVNGKNILKNINIECNNNNVTIVAGNNGSGKSTFLKILHGLIKTHNNKIKWGEFYISDIKREQSMVFQTPILLNRTVYDNLHYVAMKKYITEKNYIEKIMGKLNINNISNINAKYISCV